MIGKIMIQLFLNDLLVNCNCGKDTQYVENKRKEWKILRQALKTKSVTPISDRQFFYTFNGTKVRKILNCTARFGNFNFSLHNSAGMVCR
jgi:hypothetical protein